MKKFKDHITLAMSTAILVSLLLAGLAQGFGFVYQYTTVIAHVAKIDKNLSVITRFLIKKYPHLVDELKFP